MLYNVITLSEIDPTTASVRQPTDWSEHYDEADGPAKVAARRAVYDCLEPGVEPVNFEIEVIDALHHAGFSNTATVVDIGCSYPSFLEMWKLSGHFGELIGIEPNTKQFNGLPFWQPHGADATLAALKFQGDQEKLDAFYKLNAGDSATELEGIDLFEADANFIPLPDGTVDLASFMFSFYHVPKDKQAPALEEVRRVLRAGKDGAGILALATSGEDNKEVARQDELRIGKLLSLIMKTTVTPPEPLNSGFTSEDATLLLPKMFRYAYVYEYKTKIVINDRSSMHIYLNSHRSLLDKYRDKENKMPEHFYFEKVLASVVGSKIEDDIMDNGKFEDTLSQALFFASDEPINLPEKFKPIKPS